MIKLSRSGQNIQDIKRVLVVEAHPDDGTISAGGTVIRLKRENPNCVIKLIYFCPCLEDPNNKGNLVEHRKICKILGINEIIEYEFPRDGYLETHKQEIRNILWELRESWKPDIVLCPSTHEFHQDHKSVADCCLTIFRDSSTILGFEVLRSETSDFKPNVFVILSSSDVSRKLDALKLMRSQFRTRPYLFRIETFKSLMKIRGAQVKSDWAEAFELMWARV